jgi:hypothetical protein
MKLGSPTEFRVTPNAGKTEFRFLLTFPELPQPVEFEMPSESVMMLMVGLQQLQVRHKIPIPSQVRPRGKPKLRLVLDEQTSSSCLGPPAQIAIHDLACWSV